MKDNQRVPGIAMAAELAEFMKEHNITELGGLRLNSPQHSVAVGVPEGWRAALQWMLDHYDENTCTHENTHEGGAIWTICDDCGRKWSSDRDPFKKYVEPMEVAKARALLSTPSEAEHKPVPVKEVPPVDAIEQAARAIYSAFNDADKYEWVKGGNSLQQDKARRYARLALSAVSLSSAKSTPSEAASAGQSNKFVLVGHQFQDKHGNWFNFLDERHYKNTVEDGRWPIREIYAAAQPTKE